MLAQKPEVSSFVPICFTGSSYWNNFKWKIQIGLRPWISLAGKLKWPIILSKGDNKKTEKYLFYRIFVLAKFPQNIFLKTENYYISGNFLRQTPCLFILYCVLFLGNMNLNKQLSSQVGEFLATFSKVVHLLADSYRTFLHFLRFLHCKLQDLFRKRLFTWQVLSLIRELSLNNTLKQYFTWMKQNSPGKYGIN